MPFVLGGSYPTSAQGLQARPGLNVPYTPSSFGQGSQPISAQGTIIDSSGSANHLPPSWFNQGSSAQAFPTGYPGMTTAVGTPTTSGCTVCDLVTNNLLWIVLGVAALIVVFLVL